MRSILLIPLSVVLLLAGCHQTTPAEKVASLPLSTFHMRGKVIGTDPDTGEATISHQAIPGFMEAMTMSYKLVQPDVLSELHAGDMITADVLARKDSAGYRDVKLDNIVVVGQARPDNLPKVQYHIPTPGESVPNFQLLNQSGKVIHLDQFKGRVVLLTFIYTRCQSAEFCPRMSANFSEIDQALATDPKLYAKTHLLSISFDPTYDTPAVLRTYGQDHTGRFAKETFSHWEFAAPGAADLMKVEQFFNVGATPAPAQQISHSLSTVLIGKDGKIIAWYPSNEWKPAEILSQIKQAAQ